MNTSSFTPLNMTDNSTVSRLYETAKTKIMSCSNSGSMGLYVLIFTFICIAIVIGLMYYAHVESKKLSATVPPSADEITKIEKRIAMATNANYVLLALSIIAIMIGGFFSFNSSKCYKDAVNAS